MVGTSTRTRAGSNAPFELSARIRFCSSSVMRTLRMVSRNPTGAMKVVTIATMTMMENICWLRIPMERPMVATTSSIAPRAFMATAMDSPSQKRSPPQMLPSVHPISLPRQAIVSTSASTSPLSRLCRFTLSPTVAKKIGARIA